jgi:hypothetical protein
MKKFIAIGLLVALSSSSPTSTQGTLEYHSLEARQQNLPSIKLPYGTWQANKYDAANDVSLSASDVYNLD